MRTDRFQKSAQFFSDLAKKMPDAFLTKIWAQTRLRPKARLLEIGCGSGEVAKWFAKQGATVDAVDLSQQMIDVARKSYAGGARFHLADAVGFMHAAQIKWDALIAFESFHLIFNEPGLGRALDNALSSEGRLVVAWRALEWEELCRDLIVNLFPQYGIPFDDWGFWRCPELPSVLNKIRRPWTELSPIEVMMPHSSTVDEVVEFLLGVDRVQDLERETLETLRVRLERELVSLSGQLRQFSGMSTYTARTVEFSCRELD